MLQIKYSSPRLDRDVTPSQYKAIVIIKRRMRMLERLKHDDPSVGDYSGMRSSIKEDDLPAGANPYMEVQR